MEFSPEYWKNHRKGDRIRKEILSLLAENRALTLLEISSVIGICDRQVRKHLRTLLLEGRVEKTEKDKFSTVPESKYLLMKLKIF